MSNIFKIDVQSEKNREEYFSNITQEYYERFIFVKTILVGLNKINEQEKNILDRLIRANNLSIDQIEDLSGISNLEIMIEPKSGFFLLLDLTKFIGKTYQGFKVENDRTLLQFLYTFGNIKALTGNAFCWPKPEQLIIRVTMAQNYDDLLAGFLRLKRVLKLLK